MEVQNRMDHSMIQQSSVPPSESTNRDTTPTAGSQFMPLTSSEVSPSSPTNHNPISAVASNRHPRQSFHDHVIDDITQGKYWEGNYAYSRKGGDSIELHSRVSPFSYRNRNRRRSSGTLFSSNRGYPSSNELPSPSNLEPSPNRLVFSPCL